MGRPTGLSLKSTFDTLAEHPLASDRGAASASCRVEDGYARPILPRIARSSAVRWEQSAPATGAPEGIACGAGTRRTGWAEERPHLAEPSGRS